MLEKNFVEVYDKFKLNFYRRIFELVREREGSLSAMEAFSLEVIKMLDEPTVGQFADFLNISQSNATYKVNSLIRKGYLERQNSSVDRREYHLVLSEKFYNENFRKELTVDALAERVFLSRYHFMRLFKAQTGSTVHAYIRQKRLMNAARLIREGVSAGKAAAESGFADYSAFHRAFRESFGTSPGKLAGRK